MVRTETGGIPEERRMAVELTNPSDLRYEGPFHGTIGTVDPIVAGHGIVTMGDDGMPNITVEFDPSWLGCCHDIEMQWFTMGSLHLIPLAVRFSLKK